MVGSSVRSLKEQFGLSNNNDLSIKTSKEITTSFIPKAQALRIILPMLWFLEILVMIRYPSGFFDASTTDIFGTRKGHTFSDLQKVVAS